MLSVSVPLSGVFCVTIRKREWDVVVSMALVVTEVPLVLAAVVWTTRVARQLAIVNRMIPTDRTVAPH